MLVTNDLTVGAKHQISYEYIYWYGIYHAVTAPLKAPTAAAAATVVPAMPYHTQLQVITCHDTTFL